MRRLVVPVAVAAITVTAGVWAGVLSRPAASGQSPFQSLTVTTTVPNESLGLLPASLQLSTRIVLSLTHVVAGSPIKGFVVVTNRGKPLNLSGRSGPFECRPGYAVVLTNDRIQPDIAWPLNCSARGLLIPSGVTRLPVTVITTYDGCDMHAATKSQPKCLPGFRVPPLPASTYRAVLVGAGLRLPAPKAVSVTLTVDAGWVPASLANGAAAAQGANPWQATVRFKAGEYSSFSDSGVVSAGGKLFFATFTTPPPGDGDGRFSLYRWADDRWQMTLALEFDQLAPGALWMSVARLDGIAGRAFVLQSNPGMNMDDGILEVVAHEHGAWQPVPFETGGPPAIVVDAVGAADGRIEGAMGTGSAFMFPTFSWFGFDGHAFVPVAPPGPAPRCSAAALSHASDGPEPGWRPNNLDEWSVLQHGLAAPFTVRQTACADGWALARATQAGKAVLALYEQLGARFACLGVGSAPIMGDNASEDFDIPPSVLRALSARLGARLAPPALLPTGPPPAPGSVTMPAIDTASVELSATPGSSYAGLEVYQEHRTWFLAAVESHPRLLGARTTLRVEVYRWNQGWHGQASIVVPLAANHPEAGVGQLARVGTGPGGAPVVEISSWVSPGWVVLVSDAGGSWHAVPLGKGAQSGLALESADFGWALPVKGQELHATTDYRLAGGALRPGPAVADPPCRLSALYGVPGGVRLSRVACAYGVALAAGEQSGAPVLALFSPRARRWTDDQYSAPAGEFLAEVESTGPGPASPPWLLKQLRKDLGS